LTFHTTEGQLSRVLPHYRLGQLSASHQVERGFVNRNWIVETDRGRYFLKRRHPQLCQPDLIRAQHCLMAWLRERQFPAPAVVPTVEGETFVVLDGQFYELHAYIEGRPYDPHRRGHLVAAGRMLACYHEAVTDFAPDALCHRGALYSPAFLQEVLARLVEAWSLDQDPGLADVVGELRAHALDLRARFSSHGPLRHLVIHGDYYADNLLFDDDRIVGVFDYDKACWQPRAVELAEALIYFASSRPGHLNRLVYPGFLEWDLFTQFLESYAHVVVPDDAEVGALPDYVRAIWLSMSLVRLLEQRPRPSWAAEALQELASLGQWAQANAERMVATGRAAARESAGIDASMEVTS
jgi:homoserine kinase type II